MRSARRRHRDAAASAEPHENIIEVLWYVDDDAPPAEVVPAVEHCACGQDHETVPVDRDGQPLVCREHKRHEPCRPCARRRVQGWWDGHV